MINFPKTEPMSESMILNRAHSFWLDVVSEFGAEYLLNKGIDFDEIYDAVIYPKFEIVLCKDEDLGVDDDGTPILGKFLSKENTALVDKKLFDTHDARRVFTQVHEVAGHGILHGSYLRKIASKFPILYSTERTVGLDKNAFDWRSFNTFEWQANTFAANIIAPKNFVYCIYAKLFGTRRKIRYCGPGRYSLIFNDIFWPVYVCSPLNLAWKIAKRIRHYFWGLSIESLAYQVLEVAIDMNGYNRGDFWTAERNSLGNALEDWLDS